jgi:hypothetical protein
MILWNCSWDYYRDEKIQKLILDNFDMVQSATLRSNNIGFAIALTGGKFHVSRFSLRGAKTAQERVFNAAAGKPSGKSTGNRDIRL